MLPIFVGIMFLLEGDIIAVPKYDGCGFNLKAIWQGRIWTFVINLGLYLRNDVFYDHGLYETHTNTYSKSWSFSLLDDLSP